MAVSLVCMLTVVVPMRVAARAAVAVLRARRAVRVNAPVKSPCRDRT